MLTSGRVWLKGVGAIACAGVSMAASAGPPFSTDDPQPVDLRHWEVYVASQNLRTSEGAAGTAPHLEVNYGAAPNLQLHLLMPFEYSRPSGGPTVSGYGDTEFGAKLRFFAESARTPMVGIFPLVELPTGAASKGLGAGQTQFYLPLWLQKSFGAWSTYGGGGFWHNPGEGNHDYWFVGWQAQKQVTQHLALGGEIFHTTPSTVGGESRTAFNLGAIYDFDEGHHLLVSAGRDWKGPNTGSVYLGYQWTFGEPAK